MRAEVLDVFAGCGSLGFEALSRGAKSVTFVDNHKASMSSIKVNADRLNVSGRIQMISRDAVAALSQLSQKKFDLIFIDPPYDKDFIRNTLRQVFDSDILRPFGWLVLEHSKREEPVVEGEYVKVKEKRFGATYVTFLYRRS